MKKYINIKKIFSFYATFGIPFLYMCNIALIYQSKGTLFVPLWLVIAGLILSGIGIFFWIASFITLTKARAFGVLPQKQKRIKHGLYAYFNHPMYIGIWLTFVGLSIANASRAGFLFTNICMVPLLVLRAVYEDRNLHD